MMLTYSVSDAGWPCVLCFIDLFNSALVEGCSKNKASVVFDKVTEKEESF